jgi:hypothetical protein
MCVSMTTPTLPAVDTAQLVDVWRNWHEATRAHVAAIRARGPRPDLDGYPANLRHVDLPTYRPGVGARYAGMDAVALSAASIHGQTLTVSRSSRR